MNVYKLFPTDRIQERWPRLHTLPVEDRRGEHAAKHGEDAPIALPFDWAGPRDILRFPRRGARAAGAAAVSYPLRRREEHLTIRHGSRTVKLIRIVETTLPHKPPAA